MKYSRELIGRVMSNMQYRWFENGDYNLNIVGVRNSETKGRVTNAFDDILTLSYKKGDEWQYHEYKCTTDPGTAYMNDPILENIGCAILKPGQYRGSHKIRLHGGKYEALGQTKNVTVYRDNNRDDKYDLNESSTDTGLFGINIHRATGRAGGKSTRVDKWSAGCQVIANNDDFHEFMDICRLARKAWSNSFTYTLLESKEIEENDQ